MAPSNKTMLFVCLLVAAVAVVVPVAQGTLGGLIFPPIPGVLFPPIPGVPIPPVLPSVVISINGTVFCSANLSSNGSGTPPFPNATVQLRCGAGNGTVVASVTTNSLGGFSISLDAVQFLLNNLLTSCRLVVTTPLASCNATLPPTTGLLSSPLTFVGITLSGLLRFIINLIPAGFRLNATVAA